MTDQFIPESDFEDVPTETETEEDGLTAFAEEVVGSVDPNQFITITTMGGSPRYVPASGPMTVMDAFGRSGLSVNGGFKFFMNGNEVKLDETIPAGSTLTLVGNTVKGGVA